MTAAEAAGARDACLMALHERLAEREGLARARVEEGAAEVARLQEALATETHRMTPAEVLRLREAEAAAKFRLDVARWRLEGHPAHAAVREAELATRLRHDKRLVAALAGSGRAI